MKKLFLPAMAICLGLCLISANFGQKLNNRHKKRTIVDSAKQAELELDKLFRNDWQLIAFKNKNGYYVKKTKIVLAESGNRITWIRVDTLINNESSIYGVIDKETTPHGQYRSRMDLVEYNCRDGITRLLSTTRYDDNGIAIYSSNQVRNWDYVVPDTIGSKLYQAVCSWKINIKGNR